MDHVKRYVWIGLLLGWISSCNRYTDQQPTPDTGPTAGTAQALIQQYPQAQNTLFTTLVANQLWQATFTQQRQRYQALVSPTRLRTVDQLVEGSLPDSLTRILRSTAVWGGTFSNPRFRQYTGWYTTPFLSGPPSYVYADYTWQQQPYTARWYIVRSSSGVPFYYAELLPFQQASYETDALTDLPESIQSSLRDQKLTFTYAAITVEGFNKQQYTVWVNQQNQIWELTYNNAGQLMAAISPQAEPPIQQIDQLPSAIQAYLRRPELAGFDLSRAGALYGYTTRHTYGSLNTYRVSLVKEKQGWLLLFSENGQLISRSFMTISY
ncbi:hypothetical protein M0L20_23045 [Spirosoma sp. RP8]|uniref:Uncharacterized protein n=1 Tax=Spirosoma liriopis TaxID=2937440 RepID=A0ABT0HRF7_9BACT|nr:hypothetical protein [Spirosoma liriopis]MCK8494764.1 hypothetical protein [Spirosoma liriopis]